MADYHARTSREQPEDRSSAHVTTYFKNPFDRLMVRLDELEEVKAQLAHLQKSTIPRIYGELEKSAEREASYLDSRIAFCSGNMLKKMVDTIHAKEQQKTSEGYHGHVNASKQTGRDNFSKKYGIDPKYYDRLKGISEQIDERNAAAHETEAEFAALLVANQNTRPEFYHFWKELFPLCGGGKTVEQVARGS